MMLRRLFTAAMLTAGALLVPQAALATVRHDDCTINIQQLGDAHVTAYNALTGGVYLEPVRLRLSNPGDSDCAGALTFRNTFGAARLKRPGGGSLGYVIVDEHNRAAVLFDPATGSANAIGVAIPAHRSIEVQPRLMLPGGQPGQSGYYTASIEVDFRAGGSLLDQAGTIFLSADVVPSAEANFVGYGRDATLDLGELAPGKTGTIGLQIRASDDVSVEIRSERRGTLTHGATHIPYTMSVGGAPVDLSATRTMDVALADPIKGATTPVSVTVGDFHDAPVGRYSDVVTFRISAR